MSFTNFAENAIADWLFRGQAAPTLPSSWWVGLFTVAPSDAGGGTEIPTAGTNYARVEVVSSLANWSGTQGAGTTVASSGTSGVVSNNATLNFPTPSTDWGTAVAVGFFSASSGGTLWLYGALTPNKALPAGDPVYFPAASLQPGLD